MRERVRPLPTLRGLFLSFGLAVQRLRPVVSLPAYLPIAYKLALVISLLSASGMALLGALIVGNQTRLLEQQMGRFGDTVARQMAEAAKEPLLADDMLALRFVINNLVAKENVLGAAVYSDEGELLVDAGLIPPQGLPEQAKGGADRPVQLQWTAISGSRDGTPVISFVTPIRFQDVVAGYSLLTFSHSLVDTSLNDALRAVAAATVLMILLGTAAALILGKRLTRPIYDLMLASSEISRGNYNFRFKERRNDELGTLMQAFTEMNEGLLRKEQVESAFSRYLSPKVAKQVLADLEHVHLGGQHVQASVLFADIAGFTQMSESMTPSAVNALLNEYFSLIAEAAHLFQGHIDKFMGDCAMIVFGVPEDDPEHAYHAITCGVMIRRLSEALNERRQRQGQPPVQFRIGVNSGEMLAGNMGSRERMEYTVVGDAVNLASRLSHAAGPGEIIVTEEVHAIIRLRGLHSRKHGTIKLRGKSRPVTLYRILDVSGDTRAKMEQHLHELLREHESVAL
jgi:adenylate cyclase